MSLPALDRDIFYNYLARRANHFGVMTLNQTALAAELACDRITIGRMIRDLEADGRVLRRTRRGPGGILLTILR